MSQQLALVQAVADLTAVMPTGFTLEDKGFIVPGSDAADQMATLVGVLRWGGGGLGVIGLIIIGITWFFGGDRRGHEEKTGPLLWWAGGAFILGSALTIASFFLS